MCDTNSIGEKCPKKFNGTLSVAEFLLKFGNDLTPAAIATLQRMKVEGRLW